jgi:membrane protease YdiL (CAAX protease family)
MDRTLLISLIEWMGVIAITMLAALSPAFKRRPLIFVHPKREGWVALGLAALLFILTTGVWLARPTDLIVDRAAEAAPFTYSFGQLVQQAGISLFIAVPFIFAVLIRRQPWLSAGFNRQTLKGSLQLGVVLALGTIVLVNKTYAILDGVSLDEGVYLIAMLTTGFAEEFIFRGYIQPRWMAWMGETWGWVATSALFALWHIPQKLIGEQVAFPDLALSLGMLFLFGLLLGWMMKKSGNVLAPGLYHAIHNWVQIL